ncbi:MAG: ROK family protein [Chloroflexota bacterium]|nr:ROK family protein [Chloroflexota bacterium]
MVNPVVGVDIGGTKIAVGLVDAQDGRMLARGQEPTEPRRGAADGIRRIGDMIEVVCTEASVQPQELLGIGIGCTGPVDPATGRMAYPDNLPTWDDADIFTPLRDRFGPLPMALENDCDAAVLGEQWAGAAQGVPNVAYVTVSTGINAGLILGGKLHRGVSGTAGEFGHHTIDLNGPECYCGARGCLEALAAGPAIALAAQQRARAEDTVLTKLTQEQRVEAITAQTVVQGALKGDRVAQEIVERTAFYIGVGLANLITIVGPEVIVMGGGVLTEWELFAPTVKRVAVEWASMVHPERVRILPSALGPDVGVIGAARAVMLIAD